MPNAQDSVNKNITFPSRLADVIDSISDAEAGQILKAGIHTIAFGDFCEPDEGTARIIYTLILDELVQLNHGQNE